MFNFLRSHQIVFYSGCTILNSQQQSLRVSISLPSYQYLLFKKIIVILVGVNCYLTVALTCTYLMTNNIEYLLCAYWPFVHHLGVNVYSSLLPIFKLNCMFLLLLRCRICIYVLDIKQLPCDLQVFSLIR